MKRLMAILLVWAFFAVPMVFAAPVATTDVNVVDQGTYTPTTNNNLGTIQAGHVYKADLNVESPTEYWAGIYGNIIQKIVLGSGTNVFYEWDLTTLGINITASVVYVSNSSTIDFAGQFIDLTGDADLNTVGIWSSTPTVETVANTYTGTSDGTTDTTCNFASTPITDAGGTAPANWKYVVMPDTSGDGSDWITCAAIYDANATGTVDSGDAFLAAGNVDQDKGLAYDRTTQVHYQILVPAPNTGIAYYVWVA